jgi:hypothetical protein
MLYIKCLDTVEAGKTETFFVYAMKAWRRLEVSAHTGARLQPLYRWGKSPGTHRMGCLGPRVSLGVLQKR